MDEEKDLDQMAINSEPIKDQVVYRGFVDDEYDPDIEYDYNENTLVMIAPIGNFQGSTADGQIVTEIVDYTAVRLMAMQNEEILLDKDHASMRPIESRDTTAYGWISNLQSIIGVGEMDGLYGTIKWTPEGIKLAKDRIYRYLSPVFQLDQDGKVVKLVNVALTNRPNLKMPPIMNSEKSENLTTTTMQENEMSKEEIIDLVKSTVAEALNACKESLNSEEEKVEEEAKTEEATETVEETKEKEIEEEKKEEKEEPEKEEKEVVSKEALNSQAQTSLTYDASGTNEWENLHGQEFFDWLKKHPNAM